MSGNSEKCLFQFPVQSCFVLTPKIITYKIEKWNQFSDLSSWNQIIISKKSAIPSMAKNLPGNTPGNITCPSKHYRQFDSHFPYTMQPVIPYCYTFWLVFLTKNTTKLKSTTGIKCPCCESKFLTGEPVHTNTNKKNIKKIWNCT